MMGLNGERWFIKRFIELLPAVFDTITKEADKKLENFNARGILLSGVAIAGFVEASIKVLQNEMLGLLKKIADLKPNIKDWNKISSQVDELIEERYEWTLEQCKSRWSNINIPIEAAEQETKKELDAVRKIINEAQSQLLMNDWASRLFFSCMNKKAAG